MHGQQNIKFEVDVREVWCRNICQGLS